MSLRLGFAAICALAALWIAYRSRGRDGELLPPPDPKCQRGGLEALT